MKKKIGVLLLVALFMMSTSAMAYFVSGVDVGDVDALLGSGVVNSGYDNELAWVNTFVDPDYTSFEKFDGSDGNPLPWIWVFVDGSTSVVAANVLSAPELYFIKLGVGSLGVGTGKDAVSHYLFQNDPVNTWAVVDLTSSFYVESYDVTITVGTDRFSHEGGFGGTPVPEPSTMMLFGIGMLGLGILGKRKMNKA